MLVRNQWKDWWRSNSLLQTYFQVVGGRDEDIVLVADEPTRNGPVLLNPVDLNDSQELYNQPIKQSPKPNQSKWNNVKEYNSYQANVLTVESLVVKIQSVAEQREGGSARYGEKHFLKPGTRPVSQTFVNDGQRHHAQRRRRQIHRLKQQYAGNI